MTEIEQKAIKEMEAMLEEHFIANNHSNCDVGYSYSEIHFCKERDIKGVAHSIGTALHNAGYRKQSETVKEFADKVKMAIMSDYSIDGATGFSKLGQRLCEKVNDLAAEFDKEDTTK